MTYTGDEIAFSLGLPEGRRLEQPGGGLEAGVFGNISQFPRATDERVEAARKNAREIPDERLDRTVDPWRDRETGEEFELVRSYFNIVDPASSGAVAFTVSDGNILGLCPARYEEEATSVHVGNLTHGGSRL